MLPSKGFAARHAVLKYVLLIQGSSEILVEVTRSCMTLCDPMDCSLPGSSVHGILQARILEWTASPFSMCLPSLGVEPRSFSLTNNWCFWTVVLEKSLESPLDYKEIKPVNPKGNQPRICIWRTDTEAPILWPPDSKSLLVGKDSDSGKERRQEEKGMTEDEMVGWHHQHNRQEFEQALGDGEGQGSLVCCNSWAYKESDMTEQLNNTREAQI